MAVAAVLVLLAVPTGAGAVNLLTQANIRINTDTAADRSEDEQVGGAVAGAGDVNGDGRADVIVNAFSAAYVIYGSATPTNVNVRTLTATQGFRIFVSHPEDSGRFRIESVAGAGDVNGDGKADVIIGAPHANNVAQESLSGAAFVVYGSATATNVDARTMSNTKGFRFYGELEDDQVGYSVSGAGDVNHDGKADVIIGAPWRLSRELGNAPGAASPGAAYVVYGSENPRDLGATGFGGNDGFTFQCSGIDGCGWSVSGAGDVNGDGTDDVVVGAPFHSARGTAFVVYGTPGGPGSLTPDEVNGNRGFVIDGDYVGRVVAGAGDVNGDGRADVLLGASYASGDNRPQSGVSHVIYGSPTSVHVDLSNVTAGQEMRIVGAAADDASGSAVAGAGDISGDGLSDVLIGAAGSAYVVYGSRAATGLDLAQMSAAQGFRLDDPNRNLGVGGALGAADTNADGRPDIIVGAASATYGAFSSHGSTFILLDPPCPDGATMGTPGNDTLNGTPGDDVICGLGGNDTINGNGGNDTLLGGQGDDIIDGGTGADSLDGGDGNDTLLGGTVDTSADRLRGGPGADRYDVGVADPGIDRGMFDDPGRVSTTISIGDGNANDGGAIDGNADFVANGVESINGSAGNDAITGWYAFNNTLSGGPGADTLSGGPGNDFLSGGAGRDILGGGDDSDRVTYRSVGSGAGYAAGLLSGTTLGAGVFVDLDGNADDGACAGTVSAAGCSAGSEGDRVVGDVEYVYGGRGNDYLDLFGYTGGVGNNKPASAGVVASGYDGDDTLVGTTGSDYLEGGVGTDSASCKGGSDILVTVESRIGC